MLDYEFSSDMKWTDGVKTDHTVDLDLDLALENILPSDNLVLRLHTQDAEIRREIADLVLGKVLPKIVQQTGLEYETPGYLHVQAHLDNRSKGSVGIPTLPHTTLMIQNKMRIVMDLHANRPVNAIQALYGNRANVAVEVANQVMKFLKRAVLGISEEQSHTDQSYKGDKFEKLDHKVKRSISDN